MKKLKWPTTKRRISRSVATTALLGGLMFSVGAKAGAPKVARAVIVNAQNSPLARASFADLGTTGIRVLVQGTDLEPGEYAVSIQETGLCNPPGFNSSGKAFGPAQGAHPALKVGLQRTGELNFVIPGVTLGSGKNSFFKAGGTAILLESLAGKNTGAGGDEGTRVGCGIIME